VLPGHGPTDRPAQNVGGPPGPAQAGSEPHSPPPSREGPASSDRRSGGRGAATNGPAWAGSADRGLRGAAPVATGQQPALASSRDSSGRGLGAAATGQPPAGSADRGAPEVTDQAQGAGVAPAVPAPAASDPRSLGVGRVEPERARAGNGSVNSVREFLAQSKKPRPGGRTPTTLTQSAVPPKRDEQARPPRSDKRVTSAETSERKPNPADAAPHAGWRSAQTTPELSGAAQETPPVRGRLARQPAAAASPEPEGTTP
jgi:hypothetical protein